MNESLNIEVLVGMAVTTAFMRLEFDSQTLPLDVEEKDAWNEIANEAMKCLKEVGIDTNLIKLDKQAIALAFWGMDEDELKEMLDSSN